MTKKMAKALEASIKHHEANRAAARKMQLDEINIQSSACPLCKISWGNCRVCIIGINYGRCEDTPWVDVWRAYYKFIDALPTKQNASIFAKAETKEIRFLKSLRGK